MQTSSIGLADSAAESSDRSATIARALTIDTPLPQRGEGTLGITRLLGKAINNPKLAGLQPGKNTSPVITRANNLASLTAALLLQLDPTKRTDALIKISSLSYAQHILSFTEANPAKLDVTDALRFSLALNFMLGILDHEAGKTTFLADGYIAFARLFKDAQDRRAGRPLGTSAQNSGLSGLGQMTKAPSVTSFATSRGVIKLPAPPVPLPGALKLPTLMEEAGYIPPPTPNINWNTVGQPQPVPPEKIKSRDDKGRCIQWSPQDPCYPVSGDKAEVQLTLVQADACGPMTAGGDPFASLEKKQRNKLAGTRKLFFEVFGRQPNNAEAEYYASMRWCASMDPNDPMTALRQRMVAVRDAIRAGKPAVGGLPMTTTPLPNPAGPITPYDMENRTAFTDIGDSIAFAAAKAFDFLGKVASEIANILCAGFKALFGPAVGGVLCDIITFFTNMMVSGVAAIIDIVLESLRGTFEFIKLLTEGKTEAAFTSLLQSMGRVIFSLSAPLMVPILMLDKGKVIGTRSNGTPIYEKAQGPTLAAAFAELKVKADRVTKKEPLWPIMVVMAVVGVFSAIGGNVLGAITGLVTALAPMVATFISEPLQRNIRELATESLEVIEAGIGKFIKFVLLIFNGAMAIKDIVGKFRAQLVAYFKGSSAGSLTGDTKDPETGKVTKANAATRIKYVLEKFSAGVQVITNAFKDFNVKDIMKSAGPLLMLIPDLLLAILPADAQESMPALKDWKDAVKKSESDVNKQEAALRAGAADIFRTFSFGAKVSFIRETVATEPELQTPESAAVIAAQVYSQQFKNKSNYPKFMTAFRAELLKV